MLIKLERLGIVIITNAGEEMTRELVGAKIAKQWISLDSSRMGTRKRVLFPKFSVYSL